MEWMLKNEVVSITVKDIGAELISLFDKKNNEERLWQGDSKYWTGQSPILFPIVGSLKNGIYYFDGKQYALPRHGLVRNRCFNLLEKDNEQISFLIKSNEDTLKNYPFEFELCITYKLLADGVTIMYEVNNVSEKNMYFSIGGHPAFNADIESGQIQLMTNEKVYLQSYRMDIQEGLIKNEKFDVFNHEKEINLNFEWFKNNTLIFDAMELKAMVLMDKDSKRGIRVEFEKFPYAGIWTPNAPFLCIEPWYGVTDTVDSIQKLEHKKGIQVLKPHQRFNCQFNIRLLG